MNPIEKLNKLKEDVSTLDEMIDVSNEKKEILDKYHEERKMTKVELVERCEPLEKVKRELESKLNF
jgi:hypothetical protein